MGQDCPYLVDKPKIAIVDADRGDMKETPISPLKNKTVNEVEVSISQSNDKLSNDSATIVPNQMKKTGIVSALHAPQMN